MFDTGNGVVVGREVTLSRTAVGVPAWLDHFARVLSAGSAEADVGQPAAAAGAGAASGACTRWPSSASPTTPPTNAIAAITHEARS
jgi:hypothetical protein